MTTAVPPEQTLPSWPGAKDLLHTSALADNLTADVCVVGAGLAGLTTAYLLAKEGRKVVVLEKGPVGGGNTGRTTAQLATALDDRYSELIRVHGEDKARLAAESHSAAISLIETVSQDERIDCAFERVSGYLFVPPGESRSVLDDELEAAHASGLIGVERVARAPIKDFDTLPCLRFPDQGQFDPIRYLNGLAEAIQKYGGQIFTDTPAEEVEDGAPVRVRTRSGFTVTAGAAVVATNTPMNDRVAIHTKQAPYMSFVVALEVPANSVERALYWDTLDPYHYVRVQPTADGGAELLLVGGEDHKTGQADDADERYAKLEAWARARFPEVGQVAYRWSGQVYETIDGLAYIGRNPGDEHVYVVTGDSGMGMTHTTVAGMLLRDLIAGRDNPWAGLYDPARKPVKAAGEFVKELANVGAQFAELLTPGAGSADDIAPGSAAVVGFGPAKHAVYRDEAGTLHTRSAVCPHLGCVVSWNQGEKSWDCPCHGSRFDAYGGVLSGPAKSDLKEV